MYPDDRMTPATPQAMRELCRKHGEPIAVPGVFAWSPETGEEYSASPGDYFNMRPDEPLRDSEGNTMYLARRSESIHAAS